MKLSILLLGVSQVLLIHGITTCFDPEAQRIVVSEVHKFVPPGPTDFRGPCPGLNVLANHGFIPHNGVATIEQMINASMEVFGMGNDMASLAAIYGTAMSASGDLIHMSIGQPPNPAVAPLDPNIHMKVQPGGLDFTHNTFETDASATRLDKDQLQSRGDAVDGSLMLFKQLYSLQDRIPDDQANYDLKVLADHRFRRIQDSIARNPLFFLQPFDGALLEGLTYNIIYALFANRSVEHPEGRLNRETLMSFYGVTREYGNMIMHKGHERIPDVWYRRPIDDMYTVGKANTDLLTAAEKHPEFIDKWMTGGNTAGVNTFGLVDIKNLTEGAYTPENIRDGTNLVCLGLIGGLLLCPQWLKGFYENYTENVMPTLIARLPSLFTYLDCPDWKEIDPRYFSDEFAGYNASLSMSS